jgi:hypothetical protein
MQPKLFSAADLQSASGLKAQLEWDQQQNELRLTEQARIDAGEPLTYEPYFHAWCAAATPFDSAILEAIEQVASAAGGEEGVRQSGTDKAKKIASQSLERAQQLMQQAETGDADAMTKLVDSGRATVDPVTGEIAAIYALCQDINRSSRCPLYEPKRG